MLLVEFIAKFATFYIFNKKLRRKYRNIIKTYLYGYNVIHKAKSIGKNLYVGGFSSVNKNTIMGNFVNFNGMQIHGRGDVIIGDYFHSGVECLMITSNHNYEGELIPYDRTNINKSIIIDDFVWIGSRVMILPGTHIGEGAIIQGGSVVHGNIPPYSIAGGNPAKVFKYRDIEHFKKLKEDKKILDLIESKGN
ncbi:acyltransferase [bacterium]|nr:acyltransferase [bacterium]